MEPVAPNALLVELIGYRVAIRDVVMAAMKGRIEAGNLRDLWQARKNRFDRREIMRLVQRCERNQAFQPRKKSSSFQVNWRLGRWRRGAQARTGFVAGTDHDLGLRIASAGLSTFSTANLHYRQSRASKRKRDAKLEFAALPAVVTVPLVIASPLNEFNQCRHAKIFALCPGVTEMKKPSPRR